MGIEKEHEKTKGIRERRHAGHKEICHANTSKFAHRHRDWSEGKEETARRDLEKAFIFFKNYKRDLKGVSYSSRMVVRTIASVTRYGSQLLAGRRSSR